MALPPEKDAKKASPPSGMSRRAGGPAGGPAIARPASQGGGRRMLAAALVSAFLLLSVAWSVLPPPPGKGKGPAAPAGWNVFLDLEGDRTFTGQDLEIYGDVLVRKGANLRFVGCNLTLNGTIHVQGNLTLSGCNVAPYSTLPYYDFHGNMPEPFALSFDLANCTQASLRFGTRHFFSRGDSISVNVLAGGGWSNGLLVLNGAPHRVTRHTLDLARFCGGPVKVVFVPTKVVNCSRDFQLFGLEVGTDRGLLPAGAVSMDLPRGSWNRHDNVPYFGIRAQAGTVLLSGSTVRKDSFVVSGKISRITAQNTTFSGTKAVSSYDFGWGAAVQAESCSVEISGCSARAMGLVEANNSAVSIERTGSSFGSTAVSARNTELRIRGCVFDNCSVGVYALVDRDLGRGSLEITDSALRDCGFGIVLANQTGAVRGCDIGAALPFGLMPPRSMTRANCTAPAVLALNESRIRVNTTRFSNWRTGILACSAIPIGDVHEWFRSNTWNATSLYTRTAAVSYQDQNENGWPWGSVVLDARGTAEVLGPGFEPLGKVERHVGPVRLYQEYPAWDERIWYYQLDRRAVDLETLVRAGGIMYHNRTDEGRLNFSLATSDGMAFLEKDLGALQSPNDVLLLDFALMPVCDISISALSVSKDRGSERLAVEVSYSINGLRHDYELAISVLLGGRQLVYDTVGYNTYYLDALQVRDGGNLTVKVFPLGVEDLDLSDNVATVKVRTFDNPCELSGQQEMEGIWVLKPGVDLALNDCALEASGKDAAIVGMGQNRVRVDQSTLAYDSLRLNVSGARIAGSDLLPRGGAKLTATAGELVLDNVTFNSRRQDHFAKLEAARKELAADPALLTRDSRWFTEDRGYLRPTFTVEASSCIVNDSRFIDFQYLTLIAGETCSIAGSSLVVGFYANLYGPDIRFERNLCEAVLDISMGGFNVSLHNNSFLDIKGGLELSDDEVNLTAVGNSFSRAAFNDSAAAGLTLYRPGRLDIRKNDFSGCRNAIYLFGVGDPTGIFGNNSFPGAGNASVARWKMLNYEMYPSALGVDFDSQPSIMYATIAWKDLFCNRTENLSGWTSYGGGARHMRATMQFVDDLVDGAGVHRTMTRLDLRVMVSYSDGKERVWERTLDIPSDFEWTERLE